MSIHREAWVQSAVSFVYNIPFYCFIQVLGLPIIKVVSLKVIRGGGGISGIGHKRILGKLSVPSDWFKP